MRGLILVLSSGLFDLAHAGVASGCAVALTIICLLQYVVHVHRMALTDRLLLTTREQKALVDRELEYISEELAEARRERTASRFESQVLRDFVSQTESEKAMRAFLRRFVPNPDEGFAAFLRHDQGRLVIGQSQGLFDARATVLDLE